MPLEFPPSIEILSGGIRCQRLPLAEDCSLHRLPRCYDHYGAERRAQMNRAEFLEMHEACVTATRTYFVQVEKTSTMLAECTAGPMSFGERFRLMSQVIIENHAHLAYLGSRSLLFSAAQLGYASSN